MWNHFAETHPKAAKWVREGGLFILFSNLVTVVQYIIYAFLPNLLGLELAGVQWSWPAIPVSLFGMDCYYLCGKFYQLCMGGCSKSVASKLYL